MKTWLAIVEVTDAGETVNGEHRFHTYHEIADAIQVDGLYGMQGKVMRLFDVREYPVPSPL